MKFPSLIRTSKFSQFHYEPRYYDPIKEEIEGKLKAARANQNNPSDTPSYTSSISAAFRKRERKSNQASVVQMLIAAAMLLTFVGWVFYGNQVFYVYLLLSPLYFYFRLKGRNKSRD
ncbi:hypothetical protein N7E81_13435 [Reichenbachiella carrageenanivorans]|uniref:Uncharacterized protein n=1 Tax=Reichenbachiella carrageenanivorans TaxID=2979869 RepID=A0ABY6CWR4_9BACT|nr:hypothetical protein [Reichenbachiella carrageenanivorans]UXX78359.1 hypothetical protein N7E81_13435 [Reichenbachiella carrageenanivorans]